jgi:hypothetical protein
VPTIKDLSYPARSAAKKLEFKQRLKDINAGFKLSGVMCRLSIKGNSLLINFKDEIGKYREISPRGVDPSPQGIVEAQRVASKISNKIRDLEYSAEWLELEIYRSVEKPPKLTAGIVRDNFGKKWLKYRSGDKQSTDRQKARTLQDYQRKITQIYTQGELTDEMPFDARLITKLLSLHPEGTDLRFRMRQTLSIVCTIFGITYNFKGIGKRSKPAKRELPSDSEILAMYEGFNHSSLKSGSKSKPFYQWAFGLIATYGLRPQEVFAIDLVKSFKPETSYWIFLDGTLCDGIKTGDRIVPPLLPEWIERFDLVSPKYIDSACKNVAIRAANIGAYFLRHQIGCVPYDLRHAYAVRSRKYLSLLDAADAMGHDVSTHTKIYQRWISDDDRIASVNQGLRDRGY